MIHARFISITVILAGTLAASHVLDRRVADSLAQPLASIPPQIGGWSQVAEEELDARTLSKLLPTSYISRTYQAAGKHLDLFVAFYAEQRAGESMHSPKHCLPGSGWEIWKQDSAWVAINGNPVRINKYYIQNGTSRLLVFYWYQSAGRIIASELAGKLQLVRDALVDGRTAASIVRVTLPDDPASEQDGPKFAVQIIAEMRRCFGR